MTTNSKKQMLNDYKSGLPDFLLTFVDSIIKTDRSQILRYNFLHYNIDQLLRQDVPWQEAICVFYDPEGLNHIFIKNITQHANYFPNMTQQSFTRQIWTTFTQQNKTSFEYSSHPFLSKYFTQTQLQNWSNLQIVSIDQVRLKCLANVYMNPQQILNDIFKVLAWNQIFRAKSVNSFIYLNTLLESITSIINKKKIYKKFFHLKNKDFQKLLSYELRYKVNFETWPYVPDKFRQYQQIDHYVPTPQNRSQYIQKRIATNKKPVQCPQNCVCYADLQKLGKQFCRYTLKDGWVSQCPNRVNKIQCNHENKQKMHKCRNAQIKKLDKKKCKKNQQDINQDNQIEQCMTWGLDLYTRTIIYHSLPQVDINLISCQFKDNKQSKSYFIQSSLLKAINFKGREGYQLRQACQFIIYQGKQKQREKQKQKERNIQTLQYQISNEKTLDSQKMPNQTSPTQNKKIYTWQYNTFVQNYQENHQNQSNGFILFNYRDRLYAQILLKNYQYCYKNISKQAYRIHTKGKGARCIKKQGIKQGTFIIQYFGQLYQPWRWYQRQDFIKQVLKRRKLKNYIPQFYNIYLEHHKDDPQGYDLMVVDPNKKGNFSSRFSHSCNPNCGTVTTISNGKYYIGMYCFRDIKYGEQLTFDYCCMTESNYQHVHSICLCGMQKCRGNYLQLANSRTFSQLVDKNTCFLSRNSLILQALQPFTQQDLKLCWHFDIKDRMLLDSPQWIKKWTAKLLKFIQSELKMYKKQLVQKWTKQYPWQPTTPQIQSNNIQLYSQTSKNDLFALRFQNLFTTVDKMKYFLNTIRSKDPPLYFLEQKEVYQYMVLHRQSILKQIQEVMIEKQRKNQAYMIKKFRQIITVQPDIHIKLFYFRLCCLCVSHMCLFIKPTARFNSHLLGDIVYFYAFTHTYFTANQYKSHISEEIKLSLMEVTGRPNDIKTIQKIKRRYSSQFIWGQLVSWYKQTIVSPQASLSQDRRGTLSYPMIKSTINSRYPFEKHCRRSFIKALREKSANSWPCAPESGCVLSFKNTFKCYGTVFFENIHNAEKFKDYPKGSLLTHVLDTIDSTFEEKLQLFKRVQETLSRIGSLHECYNILTNVASKYFSFTQKIPTELLEQHIETKTKKKRKLDSRQNSEQKE